MLKISGERDDLCNFCMLNDNLAMKFLKKTWI